MPHYDKLPRGLADSEAHRVGLTGIGRLAYVVLGAKSGLDIKAPSYL